IVVDHGVKFIYPVYVGNIDGAFKSSMEEMFTNIVTSVDENTYMVVLGNINELDEETLREIYESGREIAIVNPNKADLDNFIAQHEWVSPFSTEGADGAILFSFDNSFGGHIIHDEIELDDITEPGINADFEEDEPEVDPELDPKEVADAGTDDDTIELSHEYCHIVAGWIYALNRDVEISDLDGSENEIDWDFFVEKKSVTGETISFTIDEKIRKSGAYTDYCKGSGSVTLTFNYNMVHVYKGEPGEGDYYIMGMDASINNSNMWVNQDGKPGEVIRVYHPNKSAPCAVTKICGWMLQDFSVRVTLVDSLGKKVPVVFAPGTSPKPDTESQNGEYELGQSFSVNVGASVSGGWNKKEGPNVGGKANVSFGWTWSENQKWTMSECSLGRLSEVPMVGWHAQISHFPQWQRGFNTEDKNTLLTSDVPLRGSWIWKEAATKDNVEAGQYFLKCDVEVQYMARSHVYSKTKDYTTRRSFTQYIPFPEVINRNTSGGVKLENDFDTEYIYDIELTDLTKPKAKALKSLKSSYKAGDTVDLGYYFDEGSYTVKFKARNSASDTPREYIYALYDSLPMERGNVITLHAKNDFIQVK
ncbi:MAG: hypothetical protein J1E99_08510, partial [Muribaculaceae bacterium]|nr:hypothetical protein [Muribaculaceae bacterium]